MTNNTLSPEEALKKFLEKGKAQEVEAGGNYNPLVRLQNDAGVKHYFQGIMLSRREIKSPYGEGKIQAIYTLKTVSTDVTASTRIKKDEYKDVPCTDGLDVDIWATVMLDKQLSKVKVGNEVFIQYIGKKKSEVKGRAATHIFKVVEIGIDDVEGEEN